MRLLGIAFVVLTACAATTPDKTGDVEIPAPGTPTSEPSTTPRSAAKDPFFMTPGASAEQGAATAEPLHPPLPAGSATATAVAAPIVTSPPPSAAPPGNQALAEKAFLEGRELMEAGLFSQACVKFEQSMSADPALGTLLNLGDCHDKAGHKGQACGSYRRAAKLAKGTSDQRAAFATARADGLGCPP